MMAHVGSLTQEALGRHREKWRKLIYSTKPYDHPRVEGCVADAYRIVGLRPPTRFVWTESPLAGALAAASLRNAHKSVHSRVWRGPQEMMHRKLWQRAEKLKSTEFWMELESYLKINPMNVERNITRLVRFQISSQLELFVFRAARPVAGSLDVQDLRDEVIGPIMNRLEEQLSGTERHELANVLALEGTHQFVRAVANQTWKCGFGNHDADYLEFLDFVNASGLKLIDLRGVVSLAHMCGWWWAFDDVCVISGRPRAIAVDGDGRLHNEDAYAIEYRDGWGLYARHGAFIPLRVIDFKKNPTIFDVENEANIEVRRHLIEIYGTEKYLLDSGAVAIDQDKCGTLYRKPIPGDEPLVMVKVKNSTPEPDGRFKLYYLRVPPDTRTAREAVAWTFRLPPAQYNPKKET